MKYKITDLMDLYEDKDCPLTPLDNNMQIIKEDKGFYEVKQTKHAFGWTQGLAVAAAVAVLVLGGFGVKKLLLDPLDQPSDPSANLNASSSPYKATSEAIHTTENVVIHTEADTTALPSDTTKNNGDTNAEIQKVNRLLTCFAQQGIESSQSDLDEDAELVRFAFQYRQINDPKSIVEQEDGDIPTRTLTLEQVNETLSKLLGTTISADRDDYSIVNSDNEGFYCFFHDGIFWFYPPYENRLERFVCVDSYDPENNSAAFHVYFVTADFYGRYPNVDYFLMPSFCKSDVDSLVADGSIKTVQAGSAVVKMVDGDFQLVEYVTSSNAPAASDLQTQVNSLLSIFALEYVQDSDNLDTEEKLVHFAFEYFVHFENTFSATLEQYNDFLTRTLGKTVSPADGTTYLEGYLSFRDGVFSAPEAFGDPYDNFAVGSVADAASTEVDGKLVYSLNFKVYATIDNAYTSTDPDLDLRQLTVEEADALVEAGEIAYIGEGHAKIEDVDGQLRMIRYRRLPSTEQNP